MTHEIPVLVAAAAMVIGGILWKMRRPVVVDDGLEQRLGQYNRECRLVKIDYRNGMFTADEARRRLEAIGDTFRIPAARRTKSLGAVQRRSE